MQLQKETGARAVLFAGLAVMLVASAVTATPSQVTWNARASAVNSEGDVNLTAIDNSNLADPVYLTWTTSVGVTGDNQGLAGAVVSMGIKSVATDDWAPYTQASDFLSFPSVYIAPGAMAGPFPKVGRINNVADDGGPGGFTGSSKGTSDPAKLFVSQMMATPGSLDWVARRYRTTPPPARWVGDKVWGVGLDSRKTTLLAFGNSGTYDFIEGIIDLTGWAPGTYHAEFLLSEMGATVLATGIDLNTDQVSVPVDQVAGENLRAGDVFEFTIVPEPATLLLLGAAGLLYRRRRA